MKKFILIVTMVVSLILVSCSSISDNRKIINVSGSGKVDLKADEVSFNVRISELAETTKQAQKKTNEKISQILVILKNAGIKEDDIKTESLDISTAYNWEDGKQIRIGERVSQSLSVKMYDLEGFSKTVDMLGEISGITVSNISFDASDKSSALENARIMAFEDAKAKALSYCKVSEMKLKDPVLISESYATYNPRTSNSMKYAAAMAESYSDSTEIHSGLLSVSVNVECSFEIF